MAYQSYYPGEAQTPAAPNTPSYKSYYGFKVQKDNSIPRPAAPAPQPPPNGATSFWGRITQVGIGAATKLESLALKGVADKPAPNRLTQPARPQGIQKFNLKSVTNAPRPAPQPATGPESNTGKFLDQFSNAIKGVASATGKIATVPINYGKAVAGALTHNSTAENNAGKAEHQGALAAENFARFFPQTAVKLGISTKQAFAGGTKFVPSAGTFTPQGKLEKALLGNQPIQSFANTTQQVNKHYGPAAAAGATIVDIVSAYLGAKGIEEKVKGGLNSIPTEKTIKGGETTVPVTPQDVQQFRDNPNANLDPKIKDALQQAFNENKGNLGKQIRQGSVTVQNPDVTVPTVYGKLLSLIKDKLTKGEGLTPAEAAVANDVAQNPEKYTGTSALTKASDNAGPKALTSGATPKPAETPKPTLVKPKAEPAPKPEVPKTLTPKDTAKMKPISGYTHSTALVKDYADMLKGMDAGAKGGQMIPTADGGYKRITEHSPFYSNFYKENGRAPGLKDYAAHAKTELAAGRGAYGASADYNKLVNRETIQPKKTGLGESGSVAPGQAVSDIQDMIAKHQATTKYSGDIARGGASVEGAKKVIASDAVKVAKSIPKLSKADKQVLQDYRDAREAGQPTSLLPDKLKKANQDITDLNKAATAAKKETARLEGRPFDENINPETYVHREAVGKNTVFDQLLNKSRGSVISGTSFAKGVSSNKGRVYQAVTDESGKRQVVAIKNESFGKVKRLIAFENGKPVSLGKYKYDAKTNTLTNAKGNTLKLGQATTTEITQASGQKYYVDPHLTSLKNYVDARTALENVKFIESIKNHPDFELFASPPGETAPKGYESVHGLFQFMGYKFQPKVAEALRDIVKSGSDEISMTDKIGNVLKRTIVYFPLKHNLNQTATYAVDRGVATLANPLAYKRGIVSLVKAYNEVTNQGPIFQELQKNGFSLPSADEKAFTRYVTGELKSLNQDSPIIADTAKAWGTSPIRLYNAFQHMAVWEFGDILNVARVIERMSPGPLKKAMSLEDAMKATERYSLQYKVPSRVGGKLLPGKLGRSASRTLQSPKVFFGRYKYDLYKVMSNTIKDTVNLKTAFTKPKQNFDAASRLAAMAIGVAVVMPLLNKEFQKLSHNPNAHMSAPGTLEVPGMISDIKSGKKTAASALSNQIYVSGAISIPYDIKNNLDSFTGHKIYDPNASQANQYKQIGAWLLTQISFGQKSASLKNTAGNKAIDIFLSLASVNFPKNSTQTSKLYSLQYDTLPIVQSQAKAQAKAGDFKGAQQTINRYDAQVLTAAKAALKTAGLPIPSDHDLEKKLKKAGAFYAPKSKTIQGWQNKQPQNVKTLLGI